MKHKVIFELEDGFYHATEDDDLIGPFKTTQLAQIAYDAHMKWVNHDHYESRYIKMARDYYE